MKLLQFKSGARIQPANLFVRPVVPEFRGGTDLAGSLTPPNEPHVEISDIKEKLAENTQQPWVTDFQEYSVGKGDNPLRYRRAPWASLAKLLLMCSAQSASLKLQKAQPLWLLLPGFRDQEAHNHYRNSIRDIAMDALKAEELNFLIEPEMVLEYFRLVQRSLPDPVSGNPLYLVIDCGALTCNISLVIGTRTGESTAKEGRWRGVLQPVSGAAKGTGRWIDEQIAKRVKATFGPLPNAITHRIGEAVKLRLSGNESVILRQTNGRDLVFSPSDLTTLVEQVWSRCKDELDAVFAKTYKQLSDPKADKGRYAERLRAENVRSPKELVKLLSGVIFAGGSSQLPGFQKMAVEWLGWKQAVLSVGTEYAAVPVLGAAAHVLHQSGKLRWGGPTNDETDDQPGEMIGSLPDDIVLRGSLSIGGSDLADIDILVRDDWTVGLEQKYDIPFPAKWMGRNGKSALVWRAKIGERSAHVLPPGSKRWQFFGSVNHSSSKVAVTIHDGIIKADMKGVSPSSHHFVDLKRVLEAPKQNAAKVLSDTNVIITEAAQDIFLDFGMSKIAIVSVNEGMVIQPDHFAGQARVEQPQLPTGWEFVKSSVADERSKDNDIRNKSKEEEVSRLREEISLLRAALANTEGRANTNETRRISVESEVSRLREEISLLRAALANAEQQGREGTTRLAIATTEVSRLKDNEIRRISAEEEVSRLRDKISLLCAALVDAEGLSKTNETRRIFVESEVSRLSNEISSLSAKLADAEQRVREVTTHRATAETEVSLLKEALSSVKADLADANSQIRKSEDHSAEVEAVVERLRKELANSGNGRQPSSVFDRTTKLEGVKHPAPRRDIPNEREFFQELVQFVGASGLEVPTKSLRHLHLSAKTSALVLLAGPPGIGKSAMARRYAAALGLDGTSGNIERIPVEAAWTSSQGIFGTPLEGQTLSPFLQLACRCACRKDEMFAAILDECNLAHMDYYLAPFLSAMEDDGVIEFQGESLMLPCRAPHHRLLVFGTLNVDEAGTALTDKVLDRASILELDECVLGNRLATEIQDGMLPSPVLASAWASMCRLEQKIAVPPVIAALWKELQMPLSAVVTTPATLKEAAAAHKSVASAPLGKRVARQVCAYVHYARALAPFGEEENAEREALDFQVLTRILPRLRGDARKGPLLERLWAFCVHKDRALLRSAARIERMYAQLSNEHSFDFWTS